eukprot:TRINITY_DN14951_c1_g1_i1.p1 TRINITY_DN14951_c1_g1~~TRINITY_DN14951_c1_g1_i1.p1  ORF type:complete len:1435 (-),score=351.90 TRINITY_DN14951_c1_g1_i1:56-4066(-)
MAPAKSPRRGGGCVGGRRRPCQSGRAPLAEANGTPGACADGDAQERIASPASPVGFAAAVAQLAAASPGLRPALLQLRATLNLRSQPYAFAVLSAPLTSLGASAAPAVAAASAQCEGGGGACSSSSRGPGSPSRRGMSCAGACSSSIGGLVGIEAAVAAALAAQSVQARDVEALVEGGMLHCQVNVRSDASVRAVVDGLLEALRRPDDGTGLRSALSHAGVAAEGAVTVVPQWPLHRVQALTEASSGYGLSLEELDRLLPAISDCCWEFRVAMAGARQREPDAVAALSRLPSMPFDSRPPPHVETTNENSRSGAGDDALTGWISSLADKAVLLEKADEWLPLPADGSADEVLAGSSASRIAAVFGSAADLLSAAQAAMSDLEVRWVENTFPNPSCIGYCGVSLGVVQRRPALAANSVAHASALAGAACGASACSTKTGRSAPARESFAYSELQLLLRDLHHVTQTRGQHLRQPFRAAFLRCGVRRKDAVSFQRLVLRALDHTAGRETLAAHRQLLQLETLAGSLAASPEARGVQEAPLAALAQRVAAAARQRCVELRCEEDRADRTHRQHTLEAARQQAQVRGHRLGTLPWARACIVAAMLPDVAPPEAPPADAADAEAERFAPLRNAVARALASFGVEETDVFIEAIDDSETVEGADADASASNDDDFESDSPAGPRVRVAVRLRAASAPSGAVEALAEGLRDAASDATGLRQAFAEVGLDVASAIAEPEWPLARLRAALELEFGCNASSSSLLGSLPATLRERCKGASAGDHDRSWTAAAGRSPQAAAELVGLESLACYQGQLLGVSEGRLRRGLPEDWPRQGARSVEEALLDAAQVHRELKTLLAPDEPWSREDLNDLWAVRAEDRRRRWRSGADDPLPHGVHIDPGVRPAHDVRDEARQLLASRPCLPEAQELFDLCRLLIVFEDPEHLLQGAKWINANLDVVWMRNCFRDPPLSGRRGLDFGIRRYVPASSRPSAVKRVHIGTLRLELAAGDAEDVSWPAGGAVDSPAIAEAVDAALASCGVLVGDLRRARELSLYILGCTDGQAEYDAGLQLRRAVERIEAVLRPAVPSSSHATTAAVSAARGLVEEARKVCAALGASDEKIKLLMAPSSGSLRVETESACCSAPVGRVDVLVDGVRLGSTPEHMLSDNAKAPFLDLRLRGGEESLSAELSGREFHRCALEDGASLCVLKVAVPIAVFVYIQLIDEESDLEFVFVCAHLGDMPDEEARPYAGEVAWAGGSTRLDSLEPIVLGSGGCLKALASLSFKPDLTEGRVFEAVEWEDTSSEESRACQFQRCLVAPVRVGKIFTPSGSGRESSDVRSSREEDWDYD